MFYSIIFWNEGIPTPSVNLSREDTEGNVVMPITIHPNLFRMKKDNERIKTNITLPAWLKRIAEEQKVNYSRLMETALIDYLQIPMSGKTLSHCPAAIRPISDRICFFHM